jgi:hypothetical protein
MAVKEIDYDAFFQQALEEVRQIARGDSNLESQLFSVHSRFVNPSRSTARHSQL